MPVTAERLRDCRARRGPAAEICRRQWPGGAAMATQPLTYSRLRRRARSHRGGACDASRQLMATDSNRQDIDRNLLFACVAVSKPYKIPRRERIDVAASGHDEPEELHRLRAEALEWKADTGQRSGEVERGAAGRAARRVKARGNNTPPLALPLRACHWMPPSERASSVRNARLSACQSEAQTGPDAD